LEELEQDGLWNRVVNRKRRANLFLSLRISDGDVLDVHEVVDILMSEHDLQAPAQALFEVSVVGWDLKFDRL
jgi:hypothetical protein